MLTTKSHSALEKLPAPPLALLDPFAAPPVPAPLASDAAPPPMLGLPTPPPSDGPPTPPTPVEAPAVAVEPTALTSPVFLSALPNVNPLDGVEGGRCGEGSEIGSGSWIPLSSARIEIGVSPANC